MFVLVKIIKTTFFLKFLDFRISKKNGQKLCFRSFPQIRPFPLLGIVVGFHVFVHVRVVRFLVRSTPRVGVLFGSFAVIWHFDLYEITPDIL